MSLDVERVIHSIKTALAVLIGYIVTLSLHFRADQWILITILVVMCAQLNLGGMLQKSYMRFLGTLVGSLIAVLCIHFFGAHTLATTIVISLTIMMFAYIATSTKSYNDAGTLGAVTVIIILVARDPTYTTAAERFLEISIAILIAGFVSLFILPSHAGWFLRKNQAKTLRMLCEYYELTLLSKETDDNKDAINAMDEKIIGSLIVQRKLAVDAQREPFERHYKMKYFKNSLGSEKEILRSITFMYYAYKASSAVREVFATEETVQTFHQEARDALKKLAIGLKEKTPHLSIKIPDVFALQTCIQMKAQSAPPSDIMHLNGFIFSAQIFVTWLMALSSVIIDMNQATGVSKLKTPAL